MQVIMQRCNGSTDFYRGAYFYKMGFGDLRNEFYLGMNHPLPISCPHE